VMPFDNHPRATNKVASVGLNLDPRSHGDADHGEADGAPEDEFRAFVGRFPDIARQLADAQEIRPWTRSGPAQYSSRATVGPRWCVTAGAAGFVDTLFSRDLTNSLAVVNALGERLLEAAVADDFSADRFAEVQKIEQASLDFTDDLVASAYTAFRDYGLWDAWFRVWSVAELFSVKEINRVYAAYAESRDPARLRPLDGLAPHGWLPGQVQGLLTEASGHLRAVAEGGEEPAAAERAIRQALSTSGFVPPAVRLAGATNPASNWADVRFSRPSDPGLAGRIRAAWPAVRRRRASHAHAGH
jgi:FADH2 O2-dependent halogenase